MSSGHLKKSKALRSLERVKRAHALDARQAYSDASAVADQATREHQEIFDAARRIEDSIRSRSGQGALFSVMEWDLTRRYLIQTREHVVRQAQIRDRAVQRQDQAGEKMKDAMVEQKIVQHHVEKARAVVLREKFASASRDADDLWLMRMHADDAS